MKSANSHNVNTMSIAHSHCHFLPRQAPRTLQILLRDTYVSNRTGIKYPHVTSGTCKININYMYITYTFVSSNNLVGLLVFKVLGALALPVTIPFVVEALDPGLCRRRLGRTGNKLAVPLRLLALRTLCLPTLFLELGSLVDHQHSMLLLDLHFGSFEHGKQL
jgi:hypothetical protein